MAISSEREAVPRLLAAGERCAPERLPRSEGPCSRFRCGPPHHNRSRRSGEPPPQSGCCVSPTSRRVLLLQALHRPRKSQNSFPQSGPAGVRALTSLATPAAPDPHAVNCMRRSARLTWLELSGTGLLATGNVWLGCPHMYCDNDACELGTTWEYCGGCEGRGAAAVDVDAAGRSSGRLCGRSDEGG